MPILYRYLTRSGADAMLKDKTLLFSRPMTFNDPFDSVPTNYRENSIFEGIEYEGLFVVCLTRSPANTFMWSHYADGHSGVVIGIDTDKILELHNDCFIPVSKGNIIYTKTRPPKDMTDKMFLYKSLEFSHEEEVRVVKYEKYLTLCENETCRGTLCLPDGCIRELYLGCNFNHKYDHKYERKHVASSSEYYAILAEMPSFVDNAKKQHPEMKIRMFKTSSESWDLEVLSDNEFEELRREADIFVQKGMNGLLEYWNE